MSTSPSGEAMAMVAATHSSPPLVHCALTCRRIASKQSKLSSSLNWNSRYHCLLQRQLSDTKCQLDLRRSFLKPEKIKYGSWKLFFSPEATRETDNSEEENESSSDNDKNLEKGDEFPLNAKNKDGNSSSVVEDLLPSLDSVVTEASELMAETVEAAAQTMSSVGEMEVPVPKHEPTLETAVKTVVFWFCAAISFGVFIWLKEGSGKASEFFAGYLVEQSLSVDNLFVFVVIFKYFHVPLDYQTRILTYGISGAVLFRATMILLGVATIQRFEFANLFFAAILLFASYKLLIEGDEDDNDDLSNNYIVNTCRKFIPVTAKYDGEKFFSRMEGSLKATPLFLTLAVIELSDIAFAVDSIPAVFGVTRDPFIVFSSNIFAILGLRSLYILISSSMEELEYLQPAVAIVLGFIGSKMVADYFGFHISTEVSLGVVISVLGGGIGLSLLKKQNTDE